MVIGGSLLEINRLPVTSRSGALGEAMRRQEKTRAPRPNSVRFMDVGRTAPAAGCKEAPASRARDASVPVGLRHSNSGARAGVEIALSGIHCRPSCASVFNTLIPRYL